MAKSSSSSSSSGSAKSGASRSTAGKTNGSTSSKSQGKSSSGGLGGALGSIGRSLSDALGRVGDGISRGINEAGSRARDSASRATSRPNSAQRAIDSATGKQAKAGTTARIGKELSGLKGNARTIGEVLAEAGWNRNQISGALGRLQQESSFNPDAIRKNDAGKGKHSIGIGQWNQERKTALEKFAKDKGKNWNDLRTQAQFFEHEMRTSKDKGVQRAYREMMGAKTYEDAAQAMMHYERPRNYTPQNPRGGHGWKNTANNAKAFAGQLAGFHGTGGQSINQPTAVADSSYGLDSVVTGATAYRDPYVSTPAGDAARAQMNADSIEEGDTAVEAASKTAKRGGLAGTIQKMEAGDIFGAGKDIFKAIRDPLGFALDSAEDFANNGGLDADFEIGGDDIGDEVTRSAFSTAAGSGPFESSGSKDRPQKSEKSNQVAEAAVNPATPTPRKRKPFEWSKLSGTA